jgi:hypothetical protein
VLQAGACHCKHFTRQVLVARRALLFERKILIDRHVASGDFGNELVHELPS